MRNKLQTIAQGPMQFLDPEFDDGLVGVGFRHGTAAVPVYDYLQCARSSPSKINGLAIAKRLERLFIHEVEPSPLVMVPFSQDDFWKRANRRDLLPWEMLTTAIAGIARRARGPEVVAYNYDKALDVIQNSLEDSTDVDEVASAVDFFNAKIGRAWLGDSTPFFVRFV